MRIKAIAKNPLICCPMETVEDSFSVKLGDEKAPFVFQAPQRARRMQLMTW